MQHFLLSLFLSVFAKNGEGITNEEFETYKRYSMKQKEGYPSNFDVPVPFGHITREGFGDPFSSMKQPVDNLEFLMKTPKNQQEAIESLEKTRRSNLMFLNSNIPNMFGRPNPKEELLLERYMIDPPPETNETRLKWYDLPTIQARNAMLPPKKQYIPRKKSEPAPPPVKPPISKLPYFAKNSFSLAIDEPDVPVNSPVNWTSCDEFAVGAVFSPKDIVNLKWTPFYVWETDDETEFSAEHTFAYPSNKLVNEYHSKYNKMLNITIDWTKAKLLMKGIIDTLLIAADKRGLFHVIVKQEVPEGATDLHLTPLTLRMKIEDPYLVLTYCEKHYAILMAVSGNEPTESKEMIAEASTINLKGPGKPIWRNLEEERRIEMSIHEAKLKAEEDKFIVVNDPMPPVGQWD